MILCLLKAVQLPAQVAIVHYRGHLKGDTDKKRVNRLADHTARQEAEQTQEPLVMALVPEEKNYKSNRSPTFRFRSEMDSRKMGANFTSGMGSFKGWASYNTG